MTSLLLIISFLLHIILLSIVYYLYQQIQGLKVNQYQEMENLFSEFLNEMKKENLHLQHQLQNQSKQPTMTKQPKYTENKDKESEYKYKPIMPSLQPEVEDRVETSIEGNIFKLHDEGMSIDEIAKKVNRGKTEVELLIKLGDHP